MAKADKYATADSTMRVKVSASDKAIPTQATSKPAGDNRGGQNNNKRKADQMHSRSNSKLVASVEGKTSAPQAGPPRKRPNRYNTNWLPKQSFEQLLDTPCKIHSSAQPSTHTLRQCNFARWLSQGDGLPAPPAPSAPPATPAAAPRPATPAMPTPIASPAESTVQAPSAPPTMLAIVPVPATLIAPTPTAAPATTTTQALPGLESCHLDTQWVDVMEVDGKPAATAAPETPCLEFTTAAPSSSGAAEAPNS
ncbi:hypothetical protein D1007_18842 [Hordeum vulgare]|nr:hypothetical protein D1007_18842 [Hordeum vulgare]